MDNNLYYILGGIAYGIFILQFIISWVAGEFDVDVDFDGDADLMSVMLYPLKDLSISSWDSEDGHLLSNY